MSWAWGLAVFCATTSTVAAAAAAVSERSRLAEAWAWNETIFKRGPDECPTLKAPTTAAAAAASAAGSPLRRPKATTAWFMSIAKPDDAVSETYAQFAKAATTSARLNAPSLAPYFVYTYLPHQKESDDDLARWLTKAGTRVVRWRLSFWDAIPVSVRSSRQSHVNVGAFGRLDVPLLVRTHLRSEFERRGLSTRFVLYTDADVMFARDWPAHSELFKCRRCFRGWPGPKCCRDPLAPNEPEHFLAGTEVFAIWALNSGVMLMNVDAMLDRRQRLLDYASAKHWNFVMYDQGLLEHFYKNNSKQLWDSFDDALYNARGFMKWHRGQLQGDDSSPIVWHWHGYKPYDVRCWLDNLRQGRLGLPEASSAIKRPSGVEAMLRASKKVGCRGSLNARLLLHECSLHLYLRLLAMYYRLLDQADTLFFSEEEAATTTTAGGVTNTAILAPE